MLLVRTKDNQQLRPGEGCMPGDGTCIFYKLHRDVCKNSSDRQDQAEIGKDE